MKQNHFAVQQKLTQHCKSTICQFEKLIKKRIHTGNPVLYNDLREKNLKMSGYMYNIFTLLCTWNYSIIQHCKSTILQQKKNFF